MKKSQKTKTLLRKQKINTPGIIRKDYILRLETLAGYNRTRL